MARESWKKAIIKILGEAQEPLHYEEITTRILARGLKTTSGATPSASVNAEMAASIKHDGDASPYLRVAKGIFTLRARVEQQTKIIESGISEEIIRAFGVYWRRELVVWKNQPSLYGARQEGVKSVNFSEQCGVYILYDLHSIVYVGRADDNSLGQRLYEHTRGRFSSRWDRFSWFGLRGVTDNGELTDQPAAISVNALISAFEALLIETLEPPQNRRRGDDFTAIEYIQNIDPKLKEQELQNTLRNIEAKLRQTQ